MKNCVKVLFMMAVVFFAANTTFAQIGKLKFRYEGPASAPNAIGINTTFERTTIFVENPGLPLRSPETTTISSVPAALNKGTATTVGNPGASYPGYTAYSTYVLTDLKIRRGGFAFYTLTPAEIAALEYAYDTITINVNGDIYVISNTWDGDDTLFTVTRQ